MKIDKTLRVTGRELALALAICASSILSTGCAHAEIKCPAATCDSPVEVRVDGQGVCWYKWPTQSYEVKTTAANIELRWRLNTLNIEFDQNGGITPFDPVIVPGEDLFGNGIDDSDNKVFIWTAWKTQNGAIPNSEKPFKLEMRIFNTSTKKFCEREKLEPDYKIKLIR